MTLAGFWCLVMGGGAYRIVASEYVPPPTDEPTDGRPKRTGYFAKYEALCNRCGKPIETHL